MKDKREGDVSRAIEAIKSQGMMAMQDIYVSHREEYLAFTSRYTPDKDLRVQSLHDAIVQLYEAITSGTYDSSKSSLKTYLFNLGKYRLINRLKKEQVVSKYIVLEEKEQIEDSQPDEFHDNNHQELKQAFKMLGDRCRTLLLHVYYESLPTSEILERMKYESENVLYASKSRCLKKLKQLIQQSREQ